jgi:pilus assembly protein CpaC
MNPVNMLAATSLLLTALPLHAAIESEDLDLLEGKSTVIPLVRHVSRASVGQPQVADVMILDGHAIYLVGKSAGSTNVILWQDDHRFRVINLTVRLDASPLESQLRRLFPDETGVRVSTTGESVVLSGTVSDVIRNEQVLAIAQAFLTRSRQGPAQLSGNAAAALPDFSHASGTPSPADSSPLREMGRIASQAPGVTTPPALMTPHVINLLTVADPRQVMVEVKVAEISRTLMDQLGTSFQYQKSGASWSFGVLSNLLAQGPASIGFSKSFSAALDGQHSDGLVKILAQPNVMALSGQEASFLAGGKVFIPTTTPNGAGGTYVTLMEKEYGISLHFLPKVLEGGRIWLTVAPEVSEINPQGIVVGTGGGIPPSVMPSFTTRRATTTVQLMDGEHFVIGGLLKNNVSAALNAMPFLGEVPILGALFRSPDFQSEKTELVFVVTPRLVKADPSTPRMPTDDYREPSRQERLLDGRLEAAP